MFIRLHFISFSHDMARSIQMHFLPSWESQQKHKHHDANSFGPVNNVKNADHLFNAHSKLLKAPELLEKLLGQLTATLDPLIRIKHL